MSDAIDKIRKLTQNYYSSQEIKGYWLYNIKADQVRHTRLKLESEGNQVYVGDVTFDVHGNMNEGLKAIILSGGRLFEKFGFDSKK